jgi:hypothetical protein
MYVILAVSMLPLAAFSFSALGRSGLIRPRLRDRFRQSRLNKSDPTPRAAPSGQKAEMLKAVEDGVRRVPEREVLKAKAKP